MTMTLNWNYIRQEINLGIKAHKANNDEAAWLYFQTALREDTQNVTAHLWLAYLSTDYEKRIFLLKRVLEIDPNNQRAQDGLDWAEQENKRLISAKSDKQLEEGSTLASDEGQTKVAPVTSNDVVAFSQRLKETMGDDDLKKQAKKGTIAQRVRRRISPL